MEAFLKNQKWKYVKWDSKLKPYKKYGPQASLTKGPRVGIYNFLQDRFWS